VLVVDGHGDCIRGAGLSAAAPSRRTKVGANAACPCC